LQCVNYPRKPPETIDLAQKSRTAAVVHWSTGGAEEGAAIYGGHADLPSERQSLSGRKMAQMPAQGLVDSFR
jgi:hypothetical protein